MKMSLMAFTLLLVGAAAQAMPVKLTCEMSVPDGTFPGRVDRFLFSDPASPHAPVYWQTWVNSSQH